MHIYYQWHQTKWLLFLQAKHEPKETAESEPIYLLCLSVNMEAEHWLPLFSWLPWRLHFRHKKVQFQSHLADKLEHSSHLVPKSSKLTYLSTLAIKTNSIGLRLRKSCCPSIIHNYGTRTIWKLESDIIWVPKDFYSCCWCLTLLPVQSWITG